MQRHYASPTWRHLYGIYSRFPLLQRYRETMGPGSSKTSTLEGALDVISGCQRLWTLRRLTVFGLVADG
jgi:hypothetical protein